MGGRQEFLHPLGTPLQRALEFSRAKSKHHVFRVEAGLHAKAAADIADQNAHLVVGDAENLRAQGIAKPGRRLAAHAQRDAAGCLVVARQNRTRLDRARRDTLVHEVEHHDVRRLVERLGRSASVAVPYLGGDIARRGGPYQRRAGGHGVIEVGDHRQRLVTHVDRLGRIARLFGALRDHCRNGFADEADGVDGERVPRGRCGR